MVKYLATLSHILTSCVNEWQWLEANPVTKVAKPSLPKGRTRFLDDEEREKLLQACLDSKNLYLYTIVVLSISTGMRRSELLNLAWQDVDFERERIVLKETKNGEVRVLPLVGFAFRLLKELERKRRVDSPLLFPGTDSHKPIDFRSAWRVAVKKAGLKDFKHHDCRHSFASYCVMNGSSLNEVADLLGHKSYQSVTKRYCHLSDAYRKNVVTSMNEKIFGRKHEE
ncbi:MAG TPA: site-specific integrase [Waddliaceae bacterium]